MPDVRVIPFLTSELRPATDELELLRREWWPSYGHAVVHRQEASCSTTGSAPPIPSYSG